MPTASDKGIIYEGLAKVMKEVKAIEKSQQSGGVNFKFRGIDDMYNALHDLLAKHEIFCAPSITHSVRTSYTTTKGTTMQQVTTTVKYRYYATDGSYVDTECIGEGADVSDKATSKSLAMAHKYNVVQMFFIKTDDKDDVEAHDIEGEETKEAPTKESAPPTQDGNLPPSEKGDISGAQVGKINAMLHALGIEGDERKVKVSQILGYTEPIASFNNLTKLLVKDVFTRLQEEIDSMPSEAPEQESIPGEESNVEPF